MSAQMVLPASAYASAEALAEAVADRLAGPSGKAAKRSGRGWAVCCPAHDDRSPSCTVTPSESKPGANVECKADCDVEAVLAAVGLTFRDLYLDRVEPGKARAGNATPKPSPRPEPPRDTGELIRAIQAAQTGWLDYANGSRLPTLEEHTPFTASGVSRLQERGDIAGPCPWPSAAYRDRLRVVYRDRDGTPTGYGDRATLPEHDAGPKMKAGDGSQRNLWPWPEGIPDDVDTILLVEGEKDALALWSVNAPAVGIPGVKAWFPEYAERLRRFSQVILVPDADDEGRNLARRVVSDLQAAGVAVQVREVYPNRSDGSDISDRLAKEAEKPRGLAGVLTLLAEPSALPEEPSEPEAEQGEQTPARNPFPLYSVADMEEWPEADPIIQGIVCRAELIGLVAPNSSGKSAVALDMALHIAAGLPWNGCEVVQGASVYVAAENAPGYLRRIKAWGLEHGIDTRELPFRLVTAAMKLDGADGPRLRDTVLDAQDRLDQETVWTCVDTLRRTFGADENSSTDFSRYVDACDLVRTETGSVVSLVHHTGVGGEKRGRGSSVWGDALAPIIAVRASGPNLQRSLVLSCESHDGGKAPKDLEPFAPIHMHLRGHDTGAADRYGIPITGVVAHEGRHPDAPSQETYLDEVNRVADLLEVDPALTMDALAKAIGGKRDVTLARLHSMADDGYLSITPRKPVKVLRRPDALPGLED